MTTPPHAPSLSPRLSQWWRASLGPCHGPRRLSSWKCGRGDGDDLNLLERGAIDMINTARDEDGKTALITSIFYNYSAVATMLIEAEQTWSCLAVVAVPLDVSSREQFY